MTGERAHLGASVPLARRAVLGSLTLGALSACGLSVDETVRPGLEVEAPLDEGIQYVPEGPRPGMDAADVVRGFLRAGAATGRGLATARSFLTDDASTAWRPDDSRTIVHTEEGPVLKTLGDGTIEVQVRVVARIYTDARFVLAPSSDGALVRFGMTQVGGEWRIADLQEDFGRLLPVSRIDQMYRRYRVHYPAIGWNRLVPDLRWIPSDQEATRLTRVQLGPVPDHLTGAVQSAPSAQLRFDAVPVVDGVAQVDLKQGLSPDPTTRRNLSAQLVAALEQLPTVREVAVSINGSPLDLEDIDPPWTSASQFGFVEARAPEEQSAIVRDGRRIVPVATTAVTSVTADDIEARESPFAEVPPEWTHLAVSLDGKEVAGVRTSGLELVRWRDDGQTVAVEQFGTRMSRPVYDASGVLWVAAEGDEPDARLWAINTALDASDVEAAPTHVPAPWLSGRRPRAVAVSPDSACIAVISSARSGGDVLIQVSGVARQPNGLPTTTAASALQVAAVIEDAIDLTWVNPTTLAVLGRRRSDQGIRPLVVEVGGVVTALAPLRGARRIASAGGVRTLVVSTAQHSYLRTGARWSRLPADRQVVLPSA